VLDTTTTNAETTPEFTRALSSIVAIAATTSSHASTQLSHLQQLPQQ